MTLRTGIVTLCLTICSLPAQAQVASNYARSQYTPPQHHYGRYLVKRHKRYVHHRIAHRHHRDSPIRAGGIASITVHGGQVIHVAARYADRFAGFFKELAQREGRLPEIGCLSGGHMWHSLHHWGGACDVGQWARNRAWKAMYHVTQLAHRWGLTDGCEWHGYPDCGHVEVNRSRTAWHSPPPALLAWTSGAPL